MIVLTDLQKVRDQITVLDIPSLQVKSGEIAAVFGNVDCGKDILFQLLIGNLRPSHGSVMVIGIDPYQDRQAFSQHVGVLFSDETIYKCLSAIENL